jgi:aminomethyltransferase
MSVIEAVHEDHGATFTAWDGRRVVEHYGRPDTAHRAVRNVVGACEAAYDVVVVTGDDRTEFVDNAVSNRIPTADGEGTYATLLDPQGGVRTDMHVYQAEERLLLFVPPGEAADLVADWREKVFIQNVDLRDATDEFAVFGVHGPKATEKVASVLGGPGSPDGTHSFVRGRLGDAGVTVVRTDAPTGEEGYEVVCAAADAEPVFRALLTDGLNAAPFGYHTWGTLTCEAGTPLFHGELEGRIPNVAGLRSALDFEKGCYVGQEVVSRVENRGQPSSRLVGLRPDALPAAGADVLVDGDARGEVTRAVESPTLAEPIALAYVPWDSADATLAVAGDDGDDGDDGEDGNYDEIPAQRVDLPFVEGSERSGRLPTYE